MIRPRTRPAQRGRAGRKLLRQFALMVCALLLVYLSVAALPGDAASQMLGLQGAGGAAEAKRAELGLDRPVWSRMVEWFSGAARGDFGQVLATGQPVAEALGSALTHSLILTTVAIVGVCLLGIGGGLWLGLHPGTLSDRLARGGTLAILSAPEFVLATIMVLVFATTLHWLPAVSLIPAGSTLLAHWQLIVLPALSVTLMGSAMLVRQVRSLVRECAAQPYVESAYLRGESRMTVAWTIILPQVRGPILQAFAAIIPYLLGGTVVVERVFGFPGLGSLLVNAVSVREPNLVMAVAFIVIVATTLAYAIADLWGGVHE